MRIGLVGIGRFGQTVGLRLLAAGHELSVWNRSEERTKPLIHDGAIAAGTPAEAELGSDAVISLLRDDAAYEEVLFGIYRFIDALSPGDLHIVLGAITAPMCERLTAEHAQRSVDLVVARLTGSAADVEEGGLSFTVAGEEKALERAYPLFTAFSNEITIAGNDPGLVYTAIRH